MGFLREKGVITLFLNGQRMVSVCKGIATINISHILVAGNGKLKKTESAAVQISAETRIVGIGRLPQSMLNTMPTMALTGKA